MNGTPAKPSCANCIGFLRAPIDAANLAGPRGGNCVMLPPTPVIVPVMGPNGQPAMSVQSMFPPVSEAMFCHAWDDGAPGEDLDS